MLDTIELIVAQHRKRCYFQDQRKRLYSSLGAFIRLQLGWSLALPEKERKAIAKRAQDMIADGEGEWCDLIGQVVAGCQPFEAEEARAEKQMVKLAKTLPVWPRLEQIRGFGPLGLAIIVAEAGDLSNYPNPAKLWKRLGLAVIDGKRQGGPAKGATKEDWIAHGYNPQRRSRVFTIGDALIKGNRDGPYRQLYLARKELELTRVKTKMHAHRRAQRYMEKRLLLHIWEAWRAAIPLLKPIGQVLPAEIESRPSSV